MVRARQDRPVRNSRCASRPLGPRGRRAFVLAAFGAALALGCVSPTLPLPPPLLPTFSGGSEPDTFKLSSVEGAEPNALIVIVNRNDALPRSKRVTGTLADGRGSWDAIVTAKVGDVLDISQESGALRSPPTPLTVR